LFDGANELSASDRQYDGLSKPDGVVNGKLGTDSMLKNSNETDSHSDITDTPDIEDNLAKTLQHAVLVKSYRQVRLLCAKFELSVCFTDLKSLCLHIDTRT